MCVCVCVCVCVSVTAPQIFAVMLGSTEEADEKCRGTGEGGSRIGEPSLEEVENGLRPWGSAPGSCCVHIH